MPKGKIKNKSFAVIGLGRFGTAVAKELHSAGAEVLIVDMDRERINDCESFCTQAVCADASSERVLEKLGIDQFDVVIICTGEIESSVFVTLTCKQLGVKKLVAKAQNARHREILEKIGADRVVTPEEEMGEKIANILLTPNVIEIMSLTENFKMVEIITPEKWQNRSILELNLRKEEKVTVVLIKQKDGKVIPTPNADCVLLPEDILVLAGAVTDIDRLSRKATIEVPVEE